MIKNSKIIMTRGWMFLLMMFIFTEMNSQTITSASGGGNWNSASTWVGGVVPGSANDVVIASGSNDVTVNVNASCASLTIGSGTTRGRLIHNTGISLTVSGIVTINQGSGTDNRWYINAGTATVAGLITFAGTSTSTANIGRLTITTGTLNANGGITFVASASATKVITMSGGAGTINLKGALTCPAASSTLTAGTAGAVFNYADNNPQTIVFFSSGAYYNLNINNTSSSGATLTGAITAANVTGGISVGNITAGSLFSTGNFNITLASSQNLNVAAGSTMNAGTSIITFPATPGTANINGYFITTNLNGFSGGTTTTFNSTNNPTLTLGSASTVEFNASSTQTCTARTYPGNVILTGASKSIGTAAGQTMSIAGALTINNGAVYNGNLFNPVLNIGGNLINNGAYNQGTSLVTFNGTSGQTISGNTSTTFIANVTLNNPAGLTITTSPVINGILTFVNGKITTGNSKIVLGAAASTVGSGAGKYIFGNLETFIPNSSAPSVSIPVGDATNFTPVFIAFSGNTAGSGSIITNTAGGDHPDIGNSGINPNLSVNRTWTISQGSAPVTGFTDYSATFTFINGTPVDLDAGVNTESLLINSLVSSAWNPVTVGNRTTTSTQGTGITTFGIFQIGETNALISVAMHPASAMVCPGASASFTSTSNSIPLPAIQWQRNSGSGLFEDITSLTDGGVYSGFNANTLTISNANGLSGYQYRAVFTNLNGSATSNSATLTINNLPSAAANITGTATVCQGQSGVAYTTGSISGATSYSWAYTGTGFTPSGNGISITGSYSAAATGGNLTVTGVNVCGSGAPSPPFPVTVNPLPGAAGIISGSSVVCQNQSGVGYSVPVITNAVSYTWSYTGTGFTPSGNTNAITATFSSSATSGILRVTGINSCGQGTISAGFTVTVNPLPAAAGTITGTSQVCSGQNGYGYSVPAITNATSYSWNYSGTGFTPSGNTASITAGFSTGATSGNLTVAGVNSCGNGVSSATFPITINTIPGAAGTITGSSAVCQGQIGVAFSVPAISGATSYNWTYSGTGFTPSGNTASITATFSAAATAGILTVRGANLCGNGTSSAGFPVSITPATGSAGAITGPSTLCTSSAATYSIQPVANATSYLWSYSGNGFNSSGTGTTISVLFSNTATSGILTVKGTGNCGPGVVSPSFPVTINYCPPHNMCNGCHLNHNAPGAQLGMADGNANLCMSCHNPAGVAFTSPFTDAMRAVPGTGGNSHSWNKMAVNAQYQTTMPSNSEMQLRVYDNEIVCSTCHNQHSNSNPPFLRMSNNEDALCLNCHSARDVRRYADNPANRGTHPVGIVYTSATDPRFKTTTLPLSGSGKVVCTTCHDTHQSLSSDGNLLRAATATVSCGDCHIEVATRRITTHEGLSCITCHYAHETGSNNILLVRNNINTPSLGIKTVLFNANSTPENYALGAAPFNGVCEVCHTTTLDHYQSANGGTADARHLPAPQRCVNCHPHDQGFSAQTDCLSCHDDITDKPGVGPAGGRRQIVDNLGNGNGTGGDFKRTSHHVLGSVPTVDDCLLCHYMGDHKKGTVKLLDPDQGYLSIITYDPANKASVEDFCLNCHDNNGVAGDMTPFSDNVSVPVVDKTKWLASAHNNKPISCLDCHDNGHGSNKSVMLGPYNYSGTGTGTDLMNEEEGFCLTCHGSGGTATVKVHLAFSSYTNTATNFYKHDPAATYRKHLHDETGGAAFGGTNRHVECVDCHNPHFAKSGTATAPTLFPTMIGAEGVEPIYSGAGAPTGFTWINSVTQEYQVCYKCHSSYTTLPTYLPGGWNGSALVADGLRKLTTGGTNLQVADSRDMAKEFNPASVSYHPVMAVGKNTGILSTAFQSGYTATSLMYCSSCHTNPNSATAGQGRGPHGSANLHLMDKGINATVANYVTSHGSVSNVNEVCSKCHTSAGYYTGNTGSRFSYHQYHTTKTECYTCHDTHGSEQYHLMNFNRNNGGGNSCISSVTGNTQTAFNHFSGTTATYCLLSCHGTGHQSDKLYNPSYP